MSYRRVIPRDLFNEGNFLKCWGQIALMTMASRNVVIKHDGKAFVIEQDESGWLYAKNLVLVIRGVPFMVTRPLNSRGNYPVYLVDGPEQNISVQIFDDDGLFTEEMNDFIAERQA
jgi:hypothetical protein